MKRYKTILVDDELTALQNLKNKIEKNSDLVEVVGSYQNPLEALRAINENAPDILFLDIQMPQLNGFELLNKIDDLSSQVIFSTAYGAYALDAIKINAVDYILKPIDNKELKTALDKAIFNIEHARDNQNTNLVELLNKIIERDHKLKVPTQRGISFIPQDEIIHLEGYDGYTKIHLINGKTVISSYNLGKFSEFLDDNFFKCHKSHYVNIKEVRGIENEGFIIIGEDYRVPITKTYKQAFLELFK